MAMPCRLGVSTSNAHMACVVMFTVLATVSSTACGPEASAAAGVYEMLSAPTCARAVTSSPSTTSLTFERSSGAPASRYRAAIEGWLPTGRTTLLGVVSEISGVEMVRNCHDASAWLPARSKAVTWMTWSPAVKGAAEAYWTPVALSTDWAVTSTPYTTSTVRAASIPLPTSESVAEIAGVSVTGTNVSFGVSPEMTGAVRVSKCQLALVALARASATESWTVWEPSTSGSGGAQVMRSAAMVACAVTSAPSTRRRIDAGSIPAGPRSSIRAETCGRASAGSVVSAGAASEMAGPSASTAKLQEDSTALRARSATCTVTSCEPPASAAGGV